MSDFSINEMQKMQRELQDKYRDKWEPICPETGKNKLLWMIGEIGEVIYIVKKNGGNKVSTDAVLRKDLVEEMADVLMYYNDVMLCYGITADELKQISVVIFCPLAIARFCNMRRTSFVDWKNCRYSASLSKLK